MPDVEFFIDPAAFLAVAADHLAEDPVLTTVVSSVTDRAVVEDQRGDPAPDHPRWWCVVHEGTQVVGVAMRAAPFAPYPLFVLPMPEAGARALARALHARGEAVGGVNGALPAAQVLAAEVAAVTGGEARVDEHTRLFELGELVDARAVAGQLRPATLDDLDLAVAWFSAFEGDAAEQAGRAMPESEGLRFEQVDVASRIEDGRVWLWEDETGAAVHLTGFNPPSFGVVRIGPVYTPGEQRGRGFASAAVAALSRQLLDAGVRVCLFTDQANPTSNKIYQDLGFRPVVDMANLLID